MKVPLEWLKEYVTIKMTGRQLAERLTTAGLEVTGVSLVNRDELLDLEITPNRADCLSVIGLAREVAAVLSEPLKMSKVVAAPAGRKGRTASPQSTPVRITIEDRKGCPRYLGRLIQDVTIAPSPEWMQRRLRACGTRPINNIVDITNYVLLEYGQPLHAFDFDRVAGGAIIVRRARPKEPITTLDGETKTLTAEMLVIADAKRAVAVAGVMGGAGSEVTPQTRHVLLESALFEPTTIRRTARALGLMTESSYRFERGVDPAGVDAASARAAALIAKYGGGTERAVRDVGIKPSQRTIVSLQTDRLNRWLGTSLPPATVRTTLAKLSCRVAASGNGRTMQVQVPSFRRDITQPVDLYEEVARVIGYDRIPTTLPVAPMAGAAPAPVDRYAHLESLRCLCASLGLHEAITWALVSEAALSGCRFSQDGAVRLTNPLSQDQAFIRPTLLPGLLQAVRWNLTRGAEGVRLFEVGTVVEHAETVTETPHLGLALSGLWTHDWRGKDPCDFFRLKGLVDAVVGRLCRASVAAQPVQVAWAEPGHAAQLSLNGAPLGVAGQVARAITHALDLEQDVWVAECAVEPLLAARWSAGRVEAPPAYPPVKRDLSLCVSHDVSFDAVNRLIREVGGDLMHVQLIDRYTGKPVPAGMYSVTFSLDYRDPARTLTAEHVDALHQRIGQALIERFGAQLR